MSIISRTYCNQADSLHQIIQVNSKQTVKFHYIFIKKKKITLAFENDKHISLKLTNDFKDLKIKIKKHLYQHIFRKKINLKTNSQQKEIKKFNKKK